MSDKSIKIHTKKNAFCPHCSGMIESSNIDASQGREVKCPHCKTAVWFQEAVQDSHEARKQVRHPAQMKVHYQTVDDFVVEYTKNVGTGGMFLRTESCYEKGDRLEVQMFVPGLPDPLRILCEVVHCKGKGYAPEDVGIGVKFVEIEPVSRYVLMLFMKSLKDK